MREKSKGKYSKLNCKTKLKYYRKKLVTKCLCVSEYVNVYECVCLCVVCASMCMSMFVRISVNVCECESVNEYVCVWGGLFVCESIRVCYFSNSLALQFSRLNPVVHHLIKLTVYLT